MNITLRTLLIIAVTLIGSFAARAQRFEVAQVANGTITADRNNYLRITVPGRKCGEIVVTTNNGTIVQDSCTFNLYPTNEGTAKLTISVTSKNGDQFVGDTVFAVKSKPCYPVCHIHGKTGGDIQLARLIDFKGLKVGHINCNWAKEECQIVQYEVVVVRKSNVIFSKKHRGHNPEFDAETINFFNKLRQGDTVIFTGTQALDDDHTRRDMGDLVFRILTDKSVPVDKDAEVAITFITRNINLEETDPNNKKTNTGDTSLAMRLVNKAKAGKVKVYPWNNNNATTPLTKAEINAIFTPAWDTIEVEDVDGTIVKKINKKEFDYDAIKGLQVVERWKHNLKTGKTEIAIVSVAPYITFGSERDQPYANMPLLWFSYNDIKDEINRYDYQHREKSFDGQVWGEHMRRQQ